MDITQTFYDNLATHYDKLFEDWHQTTREQATLLSGLFQKYGYDRAAKVLDCACGIGTQAIGLAALGYDVTASDLSEGALKEAKQRAENLPLTIKRADFCRLSETFSDPFDVIICMDNALPHMLTTEALERAIRSITHQIRSGGMLVASIRDYDTLLAEKPAYSPPYIHETEKGRRVSFQTWAWEGDLYHLTQYIIDDEEKLQIRKFDCTYRATRREELTRLLQGCGCKVTWLFPEDTGFYQPIVIAQKA